MTLNQNVMERQLEEIIENAANGRLFDSDSATHGTILPFH